MNVHFKLSHMINTTNCSSDYDDDEKLCVYDGHNKFNGILMYNVCIRSNAVEHS